MTEKELEALRNRVVGLRVSRGMRQVDLAHEAGADLSVLGKIEQLRAKRPSATTLAKLARALGVSLDYLVTGTGPDAWSRRGIEVYEEFVSKRTSMTEEEKACLPALRVAAAHPPAGRKVTSSYLRVVLATMQGLAEESEVNAVADTSDYIDARRK